jgi:signal transduction histidine kinase
MQAPTRVVLSAVALMVGAASLSVVRSASPVVVTSYAASSPAAMLTDLVAGYALLAAGSVTYERRRIQLGLLAALAGVAWLAADWVGWRDGPPLIRSLAMVAGPFVLPLVVHLALAFPSGHVARGGARTVLIGAYGAATVWAVGRAVAGDPFLDRNCWTNCTDNVLLVHADQHVVDALRRGWLWSSIVLGGVCIGLCARRIARATPVARAARWWVAAPAAAAVAMEVAYAVLLLNTPAENPDDPAFATTFVLRAVALTCLALGLLGARLRAERTTRAVARLAAALGEAPSPGSLQAALRGTLGDDRLEVAYWLPSAGHHVDSCGQQVVPSPDRDQASTDIVRDGRLIAVVVHDRALLADRDLVADIGAAARLAVDNERLRAEGLAHMEELRASRARVVRMADSTRRQLERDLHDGAQQRLLAVSYQLRLAHTAALTDGDALTARAIRSASDSAQQALMELRELAHGIFPAVLAEAGLGPALFTLADRAPLPVEILEVVGCRYPPSVESAAYAVVSMAVDDAARGAATHAAVRVTDHRDHLVVEVSPPGVGHVLSLEDRVGALGGSLDVKCHRLRAEIPCG